MPMETCPTARTAKKRKAKTRRGQCRAVGASRDGSASWWRVSTMQWNGEWDEQENVLQCCTVPSKVHQLHQATRLGLAALADGLVKRDSVIRRAAAAAAAAASASASHHGPCLHGSLSPQPSSLDSTSTSIDLHSVKSTNAAHCTATQRTTTHRKPRASHLAPCTFASSPQHGLSHHSIPLAITLRDSPVQAFLVQSCPRVPWWSARLLL
jgi:hypothetical protein